MLNHTYYFDSISNPGTRKALSTSSNDSIKDIAELTSLKLADICSVTEVVIYPNNYNNYIVKTDEERSNIAELQENMLNWLLDDCKCPAKASLGQVKLKPIKNGDYALRIAWMTGKDWVRDTFTDESAAKAVLEITFAKCETPASKRQKGKEYDYTPLWVVTRAFYGPAGLSDLD